MIGRFAGCFGPRWAERGEYGRWGHHGPHGHHHGWHEVSPEQQALFSSAAEVARLFAIARRSSVDNPEKQAQLRGFLERSRKELSDLIYGTKENPEAPANVEQA
jgi:hypothetical protein